MKKLYTFLMVLVMTASLTLNASNVRDGESVVTVNPNPVDLGLRASGAWMDPLKIELGTTGEEYTIYSIKSLHPFFVVYDIYIPPTVTTDSPYQTEITHGISDVEGEITGKIVIAHTLGTDTIAVKAEAYFPEVNDVWETASEITLPFTETAKLAAYKNYNFPKGYYPDEPHGDIVYKAVFEEDAIIFANAKDVKLSIYREGFDGYGGPRENNFYKAEIAPDENAVTLFSFDFNDGKPTGWSVFENDGDGDQWTLSQAGNSFTSGTDGSIAIFSNTYSNGALYPDNYIHTKDKYAISKKSVLSWDAKSSDLSNMYNKEHYAVVVSTDKKEWEIVWETTINYIDFNHEMVSLEKYEAQEVYIGFRHFNCNGNNASGLVIDNIMLANTSINGVGIQNAILPAGTYYFLIEGSISAEYTVDIRLASDVENGESVKELDNTFKVYPNPATSVVYIESELNAKANIIDMLGRSVKEVEFNGNTTIDIEGLNSGIYFISIQSENNQHVQKLIVK